MQCQFNIFLTAVNATTENPTSAHFPNSRNKRESTLHYKNEHLNSLKKNLLKFGRQRSRAAATKRSGQLFNCAHRACTLRRLIKIFPPAFAKLIFHPRKNRRATAECPRSPPPTISFLFSASPPPIPLFAKVQCANKSARTRLI